MNDKSHSPELVDELRAAYLDVERQRREFSAQAPTPLSPKDQLTLAGLSRLSVSYLADLIEAGGSINPDITPDEGLAASRLALINGVRRMHNRPPLDSLPE